LLFPLELAAEGKFPDVQGVSVQSVTQLEAETALESVVFQVAETAARAEEPYQGATSESGSRQAPLFQ
jgi:hypothetical protein